MSDLLKSKTFWAGVGLVSHAVYLATQSQYDLAIPEALAGLGMIFVRHAIAKLPESKP